MTADTGASSNELRRNSLGLIAVTFMVISAAAPLTGVAGAVPIAFLIGNGTGVPATFIAMTLIMLAFSVGYVAMSRHVRNAGAFYAYAARGLGGYAGGATAFMALVAYNAMQFGLIGRRVRHYPALVELEPDRADACRHPWLPSGGPVCQGHGLPRDA
jgi:amino acid transporter